MADKSAEITCQAPPTTPPKGIVVSEASSALAPLLFFDRGAFFAYNPGVGGNLTLTAERITADASGKPISENVVVAYLRAPMEALRQLRENINAIEKLEAEHAATLIAAATGGPPPSVSVN